jgi:hypothetical protein
VKKAVREQVGWERPRYPPCDQRGSQGAQPVHRLGLPQPIDHTLERPMGARSGVDQNRGSIERSLAYIDPLRRSLRAPAHTVNASRPSALNDSVTAQCTTPAPLRGPIRVTCSSAGSSFASTSGRRSRPACIAAAAMAHKTIAPQFSPTP